MQLIANLTHRATDLYWLAYLLTGDRDVSVDAAVEAIDLQPGYFAKWMSAWERKVVIAKALAAVREEIAASARRTESVRHGDFTALAKWTLRPDTDKEDLEAALLSIDVFPRCAVLLLTFERLSMDDVTILLDCDRRLLRKAQAIGLWELTRALATTPRNEADGPAPLLVGHVQPA